MTLDSSLKSWIKNIYKFYRFPEKIRLQKSINSMPQIRLQLQNIEDCKVVLDRRELISLMPRYAVVAELGVDRGNFSEIILSDTSPQKLILIDTWNSAGYSEDKFTSVKDRFKGEIDSQMVVINRKLTTHAASDYPDNYFDWIYIDTDHSYETTRDELLLWMHKVKDNGFILGHDYVMGSLVEGHKYGVKEAVVEFCVKENYRISHITMDFVENNSFALTKV